MVTQDTPDFSKSTFSQRLAWARKQSKFSQQEMAEAVGISQASYSELETGKSKSSRYTPLFAKKLGVSCLWLSFNEGHPTESSSLDKKIANLDPDHRQAVENLVTSLLAAQKARRNQR